MPSAVQSSLRIGRVLPLAWHDLRYAQFMVLSTVLGGYFGSRLMSNIREDKGYTYGIYSQTHVYRDSIVFFITAEVAAQATGPAVSEVMREIERLQQQPIPEEELERVRNVMMGDFIRSIDGTFELSERYRQMYFTDVTEQLTTNYFDAVQHVTPAQLQTLAQHLLTDLTTVTAGPAAVQ
jgi:predicted Zn-dependent peptidase